MLFTPEEIQYMTYRTELRECENVIHVLKFHDPHKELPTFEQMKKDLQNKIFELEVLVGVNV